MSSLNWYLHRLRAMDATEILTRAREKLRPKSRSFSRLRFAKMTLGAPGAPVPSLPFQPMAPARLKETLEADAGKLLCGKWNLFGWKEVQVAATPQWRRDHVRGVDAPPVGEKLDHRALPGGAD